MNGRYDAPMWNCTTFCFSNMNLRKSHDAAWTSGLFVLTMYIAAPLTLTLPGASIPGNAPAPGTTLFLLTSTEPALRSDAVTSPCRNALIVVAADDVSI